MERCVLVLFLALDTILLCLRMWWRTSASEEAVRAGAWVDRAATWGDARPPDVCVCPPPRPAVRSPAPSMGLSGGGLEAGKS